MSAGEIEPDIVHQDEMVFAIRDINPQAPVHVLVIPREHIATVNDLTEDHAGLLSRMFEVARSVAASEGIAERGYRTVFNCNAEAGQTVFHLHLHVLGGRALDWPPG
jgi:histidine triad (HIT) family protein